jgi:citrate lyase subunit beta/citryl-CoA lyase
VTDQNSPNPFRSLLFAPGSNEAVLRKLPRTNPDGAVIDLEDAVTLDAKDEARRIARAVTPDLAQQVPLLIRVNAPDGDLFADDLAALSPALTAVVVPKLESKSDVAMVRSAFDDLGLRHVGIVAGIETAHGLHNIDAVLSGSGVVAAYFGAEDFIADMGGVRTGSNHEVAYARGRAALAARVADVALLDQVVADYGDEDRFTREAAEARNMGFAGKLCIHPAQVPLAHTTFSPSAEEVDHARRLIEAFEAAQLGVISFEGEMVDEPVVARARKVLRTSNS